MKAIWSNIELKVFREYDYLRNEPAMFDLDDSYEKQMNCLLLEAKLILANRPVVGYVNREPTGVYFFKEALNMEIKCADQGRENFLLVIPSIVEILLNIGIRNKRPPIPLAESKSLVKRKK